MWEVLHPLAKRLQTARTGRHPKQISIRWAVLVAFLCLCSSGCKSKPEISQQALYDRISRQIEVGELADARAASKSCWQIAPDTQWGWRFKSQYLLTSLWLGDLAEAGKLLKSEVPSAYVALKPRYQYLRAYFLSRSKDDSAFLEADRARSMAKEQGDSATEADALILEARLEKNQQLAFLQRALAIASQNKLVFLQANAFSEIGLILHDRSQYSDAVSYLVQGAVQAKIVNARLMRTTILSNLGGCYLSLGDLDRATISFLEARSQLRPGDPQSLRANVNMELGKIYSLRCAPSWCYGLYLSSQSIRIGYPYTRTK